MAFNLTGIDVDLYFAANTAVNIGLFFTIVLPTLILCVLCILALFFAKELIWQVKTLLINIFAAEICNWFGLSIFFVGFPVREGLQLEVDPACSVAISLFIISVQQKSTAITLYAILVYVFIKYGVKKLKWQVIVSYIVISWVVALGVGTIPFLPGFGLFNNNGFCETDPNSILLRSSAPALSVEGFVFLCIIITFTIFTYCYTKKNTLEGSTEVKKAIARNLQYLMVASILSFIFNTVPAFFALIRAAFEGRGLITLIVINYVLRVFLNLPSVATPIATIAILKPVRRAIKEGFNKICFCRRKNTSGDQ